LNGAPAKVGPTARIKTGFDSSPEITNPAIATASPDPTRARDEMFTSRWRADTTSDAPLNAAVTAPVELPVIRPAGPLTVSVIIERPVVSVTPPELETAPRPPSDTAPDCTITNATLFAPTMLKAVLPLVAEPA
jgi:hypothetical protein